MSNGTATLARRASWSRYVAAADCSDIEDRILRHVRVAADGCWSWTSATNGSGYPIVVVKRKSLLAHRLAVLVFKGPFDPALDVDHLCRVPGCVNPAHLEPVSHFENVQRGTSVGVIRPTCHRGHEYPDGAPTKTSRGRTYRVCKTCSDDYQREFRGSYVRASRAKDPTKPKRGAGLCPNGHAYSEANTSTAANGHKRCKTCHNERCARGRARRRERQTT